MNGNLWQVAVIGLIVALLALASASATESGAYDATATENVTVSYDTASIVSEPTENELAGYDDDTTVVVNNATLENGTDYLWSPSTGEIAFQNTSATSEGDTATVTYSYRAYRQSTSTVQALTASLNPVVGLAFVVVVLGAAWKVAHSGGGGGF